MLTTQQRLDYLKCLIWTRAIGAILDVPILILLYWLGYYHGFTFILGMGILSVLVGSWRIVELEKELGI